MKQRPDGASDGAVEAVGKASEALEYLIRARGHLYSAHQLIGRVDFLFGDAADLLDTVGLPDQARRLREEIVGRNVLDGRWTFQIVEEFDDLYFQPVEAEVQRLEDELMGGQRHVFESELKEERRTRGHAGHEARPKAAHDPSVDAGPDPDA
jgi:hypothetical protein